MSALLFPPNKITIKMSHTLRLFPALHWLFSLLPCGCGRLCDWCASLQEDPLFGAAHL